MAPEHVSDPDDLLPPDVWLCSSCGRLYGSLAAARACEEADDVRD